MQLRRVVIIGALTGALAAGAAGMTMGGGTSADGPGMFYHGMTAVTQVYTAHAADADPDMFYHG